MRRALHIAFVAGLALGVPLAADGVGSKRTVAASEYVAAAATALRSSLGSIEGRIELQPRGSHADLQVECIEPARLRVQQPSTVPNARTIVWVEVLDAGRVARRVPVYFDVRWFKPGLIARHRVLAGAALMPEMFEQREVEVARFGGAVVSDFAELEGKRARRELHQDGVLARAAIEVRPPVEAGELIQISANVGRIVVQTTAIAQRDGFRGEQIGVRLRNGGETLRVEIVGENAAKVQEDG